MMALAPLALLLALLPAPASGSAQLHPDVCSAGPTSVAKKKATKESVTALKEKMSRVRDQLQALIDQPAPAKLSKPESDAYAKFIEDTKVVIADLGKAAKKLDDATKDPKSDLDSMSEMGEMESLRLQAQMDRTSKMLSTLSNVLKKLSDSAQSITQNLK